MSKAYTSLTQGKTRRPQHSKARNHIKYLCAAVAIACSTPLLAQQAIDIPAQPLSQALKELGEETGLQIVYDAALVAGKTSRPAKGSEPHEVLRQLLQNTDIQYLISGNSVTLIRARDEAAIALPPVKISANSLGTTTEGTNSYATKNVTLFGGEQSLKDIPQSITVVTRQQMDDQRLDTLDKVLANTPGITLLKRPGGGSDIQSRGFTATTIQYDGVPLQRNGYYGNDFAASSVYLDRVEVLRGAQGLLEGAGSPSGAVNLVRKRGLDDPAFKIEGRVGSWDTYGTRLEAGSALDEQSRLRSRAVVDYEDKGSFVDTISDRNLNAYGALDFNLTPDTTLGLGIAYSLLKGNSSLFQGIPRYANGYPLDVSRSTFVGADWNDAERSETQVFLDLEHRFSEDWNLNITGAYIEDDWESVTSFGNGMVPVGGSTLSGVGYVYDNGAKSFGLDAKLSGKFRMLNREHDVVIGANHSKQTRNDEYIQYWAYTTYDVFNINHDAPRLDTATPTDITESERETVQNGIYGMLRSHVTDNLTLILGARSSWYDEESNETYPMWGSGYSNEMEENGEFTPYAGLVYALTPEWSVYVSYADIFRPQSARNTQLQVLEPVVGTNYEAGVKGELFDGRLNTSLAVYRIDEQNRAVTDRDSPRICNGSFCSRAAGEVRSEGFELEAHGEVLPGWQISGGYTYNRNEFLEDGNASNVGKPFNYITPKHMLRLWSDYQFSGALSAWSVGAGMNYRGKQNTGTAGMEKNPIQGGYSVWDARIAYQINNNWSASLNIDNVFDKHYFSYIEDVWHWYNYYGTPRNFTLTVRGSF